MLWLGSRKLTYCHSQSSAVLVTATRDKGVHLDIFCGGGGGGGGGDTGYTRLSDVLSCWPVLVLTTVAC